MSVELLSDGAEYLTSAGKSIRGTKLGDIIEYLIGNRPDATQRNVVKDVFSTSKAIPGVGPKAAAKVGRFAGRLAPGLSAVANVMDVADVIAGDESIGNKIMDTAAMGIGGTAGFLLGGGPLGASMGATVGKTISDGTQFLFGGGESAEDRKLREALALLQGGKV